MGNSPSLSRRSSRYKFDTSLDQAGSTLDPHSTDRREDAPPPYSTDGSTSFSNDQKAVNEAQGKQGGEPSGSHADHSNRLPFQKPSATYLRAPMRAETTENALETLRKYDTVILLDDSGSMKGTPWHDACQALSALADLAGKYDADGIDLYFLNHTSNEESGRNLRSGAEVRKLFESVRPRGMTPIGDRLEALIRPYLDTIEKAEKEGTLRSIKPVNFLVITDGVASDDPESVIVSAARRLDQGNFPLTQVGIQFVQIGQDKGAKKFLEELDDDLTNTHKIRDIVDTTSCEITRGKISADILTKVLIGGINRRVDRKGVLSVISG
ncbi:hypothetical protein HGRIS_010084 [Hohenbuehelia grisea]|uniref:VWFA domain-containing protein n=2 Tax=Hohenbuehelia grisea TaxID=104357 RepID=A0ABR3J3S3_9AGAR